MQDPPSSPSTTRRRIISCSSSEAHAEQLSRVRKNKRRFVNARSDYIIHDTAAKLCDSTSSSPRALLPLPSIFVDDLVIVSRVAVYAIGNHVVTFEFDRSSSTTCFALALFSVC